MRVKRSIFAAMASMGTAGSAVAQESDLLPGQPHPWQMGLQEALSPIEAQIHWFSDYTLAFIIPITILVAVLLAWVVFRYRASRNPVPSRTSHNTMIEVVWTLAPVIVLLFLAVPSFQLLTAQYNPPSEPELTVKATGYQWYWGYEYPEHDIEFLSFMLDRESLEEYGYSQDEYLLATDTAVVVPTGQTVVLQVTAADVIHSWTIPAFGVKQDGVPGRLAEAWFRVEPGMEGIYFGQCSELCGLNHAYMPITVMAVTPAEYEAWLASGGTDFASLMDGTIGEIELAAVEQ